MTPKTYLIETSAVLPVIGRSSTPHNEYVRSELSDGNVCTSIYVRKEFIARFVCDVIELAENVEISSSPADAFSILSEEWGRKSKFGMKIISWLLQQNGSIVNSHHLAVELANVAVQLILTFDLALESRIGNKCGCKKGDRQVDFDMRTPVRKLSEFRKEFLADVVDCPVNRFLKPGKSYGRLAKLISSPALNATQKIKKAVYDNADEINTKGESISCSSCRKIGDAIIALEQSIDVVLTHTDHSFSVLCMITNRSNKLLMSNISFKKALPKPPTIP